jgi:hypothetical protein
MSFAVVFGLIFLQLSMVRDISYLILIACFLFGVMGLAMYPVGLEMSAECTFPVSETTSTGLVVLCGQVQAVIFLAIMTQFAKPLASDKLQWQACDSKDPSKAHDHRTSIYVRVFLISYQPDLFLGCFRDRRSIGPFVGLLFQTSLQANECRKRRSSSRH